MSDEANSKSRDKTRLCPSCRMAISILATKCRFCGENVGRPKDETRNLSIQDLGGETIVHYAPSSNVMDALEAFRAEETTTKTPAAKKKSLFRRKTQGPEGAEPASAHGILTQLDERSKALASLAMPARPTIQQAPKPSWMKKTAFLGMFVAAVVILYFGCMQAFAMIKGWGAHPARTTYVNRAPAILDQDGNPLVAVQAAADAVSHEDSAENREVMDRARAYLTQKIQALLDKPRITWHDLTEASDLASKGWRAAPSLPMQQLRSRVNREMQAYSLHVVSTDTKSSPPKAVLELYDKSHVVVQVGNTVWHGRFTVHAIRGGEVLLVDNRCKVPPYGNNRGVTVTREGIPH